MRQELATLLTRVSELQAGLVARGELPPRGVDRDAIAPDALEELRAKLLVRLEESERHYRLLAENAADMISTHRADGTYLYVSPACERLLGHPPSALRGRLPCEHAYPQERSRVHQAFTVGATGATERIVVARFRHRDGHDVWIESHVRAIEGTEEDGWAGLAVSRDVTERVEVEARLRDSEARARAVVETAGDAIVTADERGRITLFNPAAEKLFGYSANELMGKDVALLAAMPQKSADHDHYVKARVAGKGRGVEGMRRRLHGRHRDGSLIPIDIALTEVTLEGGARAFTAIIHDMTEQQRTEEAMRLARQEAEQASAAKSTFLAQMSHEIRTPMNAILGFAQLLDASGDLPPHLREHVEIINKSGEHLMTLINDVLEMSRIESGRVQINEGVFDLAELADGLERMFRVRARGAGLEIVAEHARPLPRAVRGDAGKLRQILVNLLSNAVKFTSNGGIVMRTSIVDQGPDRSVLRVEIADTGEGIAAEEIEGIFRPFEQTRLGARKGGTGLGLGISRSFAELMGGTLLARSEPGAGSTFTLEVPLVLVEAAAQPRARLVTRLAPGQPSYRVLAVDDTETNLDVLSAILRPLGFEVDVARDGAEALERASSLRPHLVLVDMQMPVIDGEGVIREIRSWPGARPRLVAVTAAALDHDRARILALGADGFVRKPYRVSELLDAIASVLPVVYSYADTAEWGEEPPSITAVQVASSFSPEVSRALRRQVELGDIEEARKILDAAHASAPAVVDALRLALQSFDYALVLSVLPSSPSSDVGAAGT